MPELNLDLAVKVRDAILNDPNSHDQGVWGKRSETCGTVMCLAGHTCVQAGVELEWRPSVFTEGAFHVDFTASGEEVPNKAAELLGLDEDQAMILFWCTDDERAMDMLDALINAAKVGLTIDADELEEI